MGDNRCKSDSKENMFFKLPIGMSQSIDLKGNSISSQSEKQSNLQETPYFDKSISYSDSELFKNQIEFQNSIQVKSLQLDQEWSLQKKSDDLQSSIQKQQDDEPILSNKTETEIVQKDQDICQKTLKRADQDDLTISNFKPEVLHPTIQRPMLKKEKQKKEYIIEFKEIKRTGNTKKRSHEDMDRQVIFRDKALIQIGVSKDNDYIINDQMGTISKKHATLKYDENKDNWQLIDQNSSNGTYQITNEIILKPQIQLLIGTFLCEVKDIKFDQGNQSKKIFLFFQNIVDDNIPSFKLDLEINNRGLSQRIGKIYQKQLKEDISINDFHCSIEANEKFDIVLKNQNENYDQVGVKLTPNVPQELKQDSIIKFGFLNKYSIQITNKQCIETIFSQSSQELSQQNEMIDICLICKQPDQKLFSLQPCQHKVLCIECIMTKSEDKCPSCLKPFVDFN